MSSLHQRDFCNSDFLLLLRTILDLWNLSKSLLQQHGNRLAVMYGPSVVLRAPAGGPERDAQGAPPPCFCCQTE